MYFESDQDLTLLSTSSSLLGEQEIRDFDCGHFDLNEALRTNYNRYDIESGHVFAIVNSESTVLGFISCSLFSLSLTSEKKNIGVSIDYLGIHKEVQRRGLGSLLVVLALRLAITIDCWLPIEAVRVFALEDAVDFYEKLGFIDARYTPINNGQPVEMYFPIKKLRESDILPFTELFSISFGKG